MKSLLMMFILAARNLRSRELFRAINQYCSGDVLDVGGADFIQTVIGKGAVYNSWTVLEISRARLLGAAKDRVRFIIGDGCEIPFKSNSFNTVINVQVLEHVFNPIEMVNEISRMLKPNGYAIFLIPQTSTLHAVPFHYYNFTRFWIEKVMYEAGLEVVSMKPLGGVWSSMASHLVFFFFQSIHHPAYSTKQNTRNIFFYLLYPVMIIYALLSIPICMLLSLGDLSEEPNNMLAVVKK